MSHRILLLGVGGDPSHQHEPAEGPFSFLSVANAAFVYDGRMLSGADGSNLSSFADGSTSGLSVTQSDPLKRPILRTGANGLGGHPILHFDGAQTLSRPNTPATALSLSDQMTFYALVRLTSYEFMPLGWEQYPDEDGTKYGRIRPVASGGTLYFQHGGDPTLFVSASGIAGDAPNDLLNNWRWVEYWRNGSVAELRVGGALVASGAMPNPLTQDRSGEFFLGAGPSGSLPLSGDVAAVVGYKRALNASERDYLALGVESAWAL